MADVYGALSSQARTLLSHYMDSKLNPTVKVNPGVCLEVWSGVMGAIVARAGRFSWFTAHVLCPCWFTVPGVFHAGLSSNSESMGDDVSES